MNNFISLSQDDVSVVFDPLCLDVYENRPDPCSINCFIACIESYAKRHNLVEDISLCHFEHEFHLFSSGKIDVNDVRLDNAWPHVETQGMVTHRVMERLRERVGLTVTQEVAYSFDAWVARLEQLSFKTFTLYDVYNVESRREYQQRHGNTMVIINGYDPKIQYFGIVDRKLGQSFTSLNNMRESFEHFKRKDGGLHFFHTLNVPITTPVDDISISGDIERILNFYNTQDENKGKNGLAKFANIYPDLIALNQPFWIPGAVQFFGERFANARFFKRLLALGHKKLTNHYKQITKLIEQYEELGQLWYSFDVFHMFSIDNNNFSVLKKNLSIIQAVMEKEDAIMKSLEALYISGAEKI